MKRSWILGAFVLLLAPAPASAGLAGHGVSATPIVFASNRAGGSRELFAVNPDGTGEHRLTYLGLNARQPAWSPDGRRIAFAGLAAGNWDIYTVDATGGDLRRLTSDPGQDFFPRWTPDGRVVWQHGLFPCPCTAWIANADGSGQTQLPLPGNVLTLDPGPSGQKLAYATDAGGSWSLHVAKLNGSADRQVTTGPAAFGDFDPRWSPDGNTLSFLRDDTGSNNDVYTVAANGKDLRRVVATPDHNEFWPTWSSDGSALVFEDATAGRLRSVSLADGSVSPVSTVPSAPLVEPFDGAVRDDSLWHQISDPGGTIGLENGRLVASISGSAVPGGQYNQVDEHWGSQCSLDGDFDYQVDYALVDWPANSGFFAALDAFFAGGAIARTSSSFDPSAGEQYQAWANTVPFQNGTSNTSDLSGSFRLTRTNGVLGAFYRAPGGPWVQMLNAPGAGGTTVYGLGLSVTAAGFAHLDGSVAYDNFRLNSGVLTCPSWWQDYAPDIARS